MEKLDRVERWQVQQRMMQVLLAERLNLKVHRETKEFPILALVVAKNGPKLHEATPGDKYKNGVKGIDGKGLGAGSMMAMDGKMIFQAYSMDSLAGQLTATLGRIVQNKTGLKGVYDFTLQYSPDDARVSMPNAAVQDSPWPSIFTAVQEQLGLKLEPSKAPAELLVIDHVEKPSEN
jgi:uncharacterized protein (TIGR03435 family)